MSADFGVIADREIWVQYFYGGMYHGVVALYWTSL